MAMWAKNLLLIAVVVGGGVAVRASLFPLSSAARQLHLDPGLARDLAFQEVVRHIDESFRATWSERAITPAPRADDLTIARRLSLALTGTIPSLEEIRQFENHPPTHRIAGWTNYLLHDRRYADYFAERLARAFVGTEDGPFIAYRKRRYLAWLSDELLKNTAYAEIVRQMIAAEGLNTDQPAVNFIAATYDDNKKSPDPEKLAIRVSRAFLGLRIDCAQCHDHFLEPEWKQTHFQALAAFFGRTKQVITNIADVADGEYTFEDRVHGGQRMIAPNVPMLRELLPEDGTPRERLAAWVTHPQNVYFARATVNRVWAMMTGRPLLHAIEAQTLEEMSDAAIPPALRILAADFATHGYDLKRLILLIACTEVFQRASAADFDISDEHEQTWAVFPLSRLRPEQIIGSVIQAASVKTINQQSHVFTRLLRYFNERDFVKRYGDIDDDEFTRSPGTIPQRLLMMNNPLVNERAKEDLLNASAQIAMFAPSDAAAVETAYLAILTRRPTDVERQYFAAKLAGTHGDARQRLLADLYWTLFNSTEFAFHH
jgi:hypothetical protein